MKFQYKLGVIGYGNMASCIVKRAIETGVIASGDVLLYDVDWDKLKYSGLAYTKVCADINRCEYILLSVKPQSVGEVYASFCGNENTIISIMAGVPSEAIAAGMKNVNAVRCMPNTPCMIGYGAIGVDFTGLTDEKRDFIRQLLSSTGTVVEVEESLLNAVTCVSGSGPAYFYYFLNSIIRTGTSKGLSNAEATALAVQTAIGAAKMVENSKESLETLIDRVCSRGGTTIEAINHFKECKIGEHIEEGLLKCYEKSCEMEAKNR